METWTPQQFKEHFAKAKPPSKPKSKSKGAKVDAKAQIEFMLISKNIEYVTEHIFHPKRKWRFDYAILDKKVAIEYEGIFGGKSRHTTVLGYSEDAIKYNEASKLGWTVLRYTQTTYHNLLLDLKSLEMSELTV